MRLLDSLDLESVTFVYNRIFLICSIFTELQASEVQVCAKAENRGLYMAFLVTLARAFISVVSHLFQRRPNQI